MRSETIKLYKTWLETATAKQIEFVDKVFEMAEKNYEKGGHWIAECYGPEEILSDFKTLAEAKKQCGYHNESALNARQGLDTDPELAAFRAFGEWN